MRLDKYLTQAGIGSRSQVKTYICKGLVTVDGRTETRGDAKIDEAVCRVICRGAPVSWQEHVYYMLNKPAGCVSATRDGKERTVLDLIREPDRRNLFPAGRLDKDTEGLLLLTDDGMLAHRLLVPGRHVPKRYLARLSCDLSDGMAELLEQGLDIGEKRLTLPAVFAWKDREKREALLTVTEGKYHQVRRMFEAVGAQVLYLKRLSMGSLALDEGLAPGQYRPLLQDELRALRAAAGMQDK